MGESEAKTGLFILAHPDDEVVFAPLLARLASERRQARVIYLTDGSSGATPSVRNAETVRALASLGISAAQLCFAGHQRGIRDGQLHRHLDDALDAVEEWAARCGPIDSTYTLAWEGGHPDHDAAHVVAAAFAARHRLGDSAWQVPFYRASDLWPAPFFQVGSPLAANGPIVSIPLQGPERRLPISLMRFYPSQWRSFAGLGPLIAWRALTRDALLLQRVRWERLGERPTTWPLLYESRNGVSFDEFLAASGPFLAAHREPDASPAATQPREMRSA